MTLRALAGLRGPKGYVLIELQKTDPPSDLLRLLQYLGTQYRAEENMVPDADAPECKRKHALPMIAIYLLGHQVDSIEVPVRKDREQGYLLNIDEAVYRGDEDQRLIFHRLLTAGASKEMCELMEMEELLFRDYDERGVELLKQRKQLKKQSQKLQEKSSQLQEKDEQLRQTIRLLIQASVPANLIAERLNISQEAVRQIAGGLQKVTGRYWHTM